MKFRENLCRLYNLDVEQFAKLFYGRDSVDYYIQGKFNKFKINALGAILDLDCDNFSRVAEFLFEEVGNAKTK